MSVEKFRYGKAYITSTILLTAGSMDAQSNPTLATGDVEISKDDGAFANLATLPTVTPASDVKLKISLSSTESQARRIMIRFKDAAGAEWEEQTITFEMEDPRNGLVEYEYPTGFSIGRGMINGEITRAGHPTYGVIYAESAVPDDNEFNHKLLTGSLFYDNYTGFYYIILGGYFLTDNCPAAPTLSKVFGIALDTTQFNVAPEDTTTIFTSWGGVAATEIGNGSGWTFIVMKTAFAYPDSAFSDGGIYINPSLTHGILVNNMEQVGIRNLTLKTGNDNQSGSDSAILFDTDNSSGPAIKATANANAIFLDVDTCHNFIDVNHNDIGVKLSSQTGADNVQLKDATIAISITPTETALFMQNGVSASAGQLIHLDNRDTTGAIMRMISSDDGVVIDIEGNGIDIDAVGRAVKLVSSTDIAFSILSATSSGGALDIQNTAAVGNGVYIRANGDALLCQATGSDGNGARFLKNGTGKDLVADSYIDDIWNEAQSGHSTVGTFGYFLDAQVSAAGGGLTSQQTRDAMKLAPTGGSPASGSVDEHLDLINTDTIAILVDTGTSLPASLAAIDAKIDIIDTNVDTIVSKLPTGNISELALTSSSDGVTIANSLEYTAAILNGRTVFDSGSGNVNIKKRDNSTDLTVVNVSTTERTRIS